SRQARRTSENSFHPRKTFPLISFVHPSGREPGKFALSTGAFGSTEFAPFSRAFLSAGEQARPESVRNQPMQSIRRLTNKRSIGQTNICKARELSYQFLPPFFDLDLPPFCFMSRSKDGIL